jgi:hypothetical protein
MFWNAEYRSFEFDLKGIEGRAPLRRRYRLVEGEESKGRVHKPYKEPSLPQGAGVETLNEQGVSKLT